MRRLLSLLCLGSLGLAGAPAPAEVRIGGPASVEKPPDGVRGRPYISSVVDLSPRGYVEEEYLLSGKARTYEPGRAPRSARYKTRVLVRRPADGSRFNGTALVEWFNVTSQVDIDLDWAAGYRYLTQDRFAYVGVSAQAAGVRALQLWDPARYGSLSHPGDDYSFDIFAQAVAAVRAGDPLLGPNTLQRIIASGHSQAGIRLHAYVEKVQDQTNVIDGFLIRGDSERAWTAEPSVPVLHYMTESEAVGVVEPGVGPFRADSDHYRLWHIAGAAHSDHWSNVYWLNTEMPRDWIGLPVPWNQKRAGVYDGSAGSPCNEFPQRYSVDAALFHLDRWLRGGDPPPSMPRLEFRRDGSLARDVHGNALGGVRYPVIDVPVATYTGEDGCPLAGRTTRFDTATLTSLYPTHDAYVSAIRAAAEEARAAGLLLDLDFNDLMTRANAAPVPR